QCTEQPNASTKRGLSREWGRVERSTAFGLVVCSANHSSRLSDGTKGGVGTHDRPLSATSRRHERVERFAGTSEPVGRHVDVDARVSRCPVKDAWKDLAHRRTIAPLRLAPGSGTITIGRG